MDINKPKNRNSLLKFKETMKYDFLFYFMAELQAFEVF